ncbi:MAG TPA: hypothetical protein VLZ76_04520 [Lysobacter sp.]|nr:hypothetical protein [Lysobacter sp.]
MKTDGPVFGERSFSKVAAVFDSRAVADEAAARVRGELGLTDAQVQVVAPGDPRPGRRIEPDSRGIWRTAVKAHITFGLLGAVAGVVVFLLLWGMEIRAVRESPWAAGGALLFFCTVFGLFTGGFVTLRPDQDVLINTVFDAIERGRFAVVAQPDNHQQRDRISELLEAASGKVVRTL